MPKYPLGTETTIRTEPIPDTFWDDKNWKPVNKRPKAPKQPNPRSSPESLKPLTEGVFVEKRAGLWYILGLSLYKAAKVLLVLGAVATLGFVMWTNL